MHSNYTLVYGIDENTTINSILQCFFFFKNVKIYLLLSLHLLTSLILIVVLVVLFLSAPYSLYSRMNEPSPLLTKPQLILY